MSARRSTHPPIHSHRTHARRHFACTPTRLHPSHAPAPGSRPRTSSCPKRRRVRASALYWPTCSFCDHGRSTNQLTGHHHHHHYSRSRQQTAPLTTITISNSTTVHVSHNHHPQLIPAAHPSRPSPQPSTQQQPSAPKAAPLPPRRSSSSSTSQGGPPGRRVVVVWLNGHSGSIRSPPAGPAATSCRFGHVAARSRGGVCMTSSVQG
ncbi:uncharacterized protein K452DRAFT_139003 [Aplosporella prunicola CBS 121167]|uniref:Uncharacterized protein n=1 Tax=Aplosporella prunicola CBS 121167 TaxID=1176127 RepID=A0A6A6AWZ3_9PEZI|nr:uncharacterized protein K452DRAFT_139003 [Aplosporella prunicola CBS 121167]KAF2136260.1 hypothetical protein K452DRAFT_139003 [Aplosporella prunicola CBS 121167]